MARKYFTNFFKPLLTLGANVKPCQVQERLLHSSPVVFTVQAGKVKITPKRNKPVTYEDSFSPRHIAHRKSWNSWNTSTIEGGLRPAEIAIEDMFIRKFMAGTFPRLVRSKVIIKRQYNIIRIAALMHPGIGPQEFCFLIGYTETLLSYWLQCIVKLELQMISSPQKMIFKFV